MPVVAMETKKRSILIVDDSRLIIERLINLLEGLEEVGSILQAGSFAQTESLLSENRPDIAILDIHLPDRSGIELLRYIKKKFPGIIVIMLSNQSGEYYQKLCRVLGTDFFLDKSSGFDLVPQIIHSIG
jgi:DNA-binding NarL/FixJ family response regulator